MQYSLQKGKECIHLIIVLKMGTENIVWKIGNNTDLLNLFFVLEEEESFYLNSGQIILLSIFVKKKIEKMVFLSTTKTLTV